MSLKLKTGLAIFLLASHANAGLKSSNEKYEKWQLTPPVGSLLKVLGPFDTKALCMAAAPAVGIGYKCKDVTSFDITVTCDDVPMPAWPTKMNEEGFMEQPGITGEVKDAGAGKVLVLTKQEGFIPGPGWPNCWIPGLVPYKGEVAVPDGPLDQSPGPWVYCVDYGKVAPYIGKTCPKEAKGGCYIPPNAPDVCL